jgi:hypothetical protein
MRRTGIEPVTLGLKAPMLACAIELLMRQIEGWIL